MFSNACESLVSLAITVGEQSASNLDTRADLAVTAQINVGKKSASDADNMLIRLFRLRFSGTLARTETRIQAARKYLISNDPNHNSRVVHMLESALRTEHWLCSIILSDDARPDALGWEPCEEEIEDWFSQWLDLAADIDLNGSPEIRDSVRNVLADKMTGIWLHVPSLRAKVGQIARQLHDGAPWMEGWYSFKQMLNHTNRKGWGISSNDMATVRQFIDDLAPTNLTDRVRAEIVEKWSVRNAEGEDYQTCWDRRVRRLERLGQELAASPDVLASVEKDLFARNNQSLFALGVGLAQGSEQPERIWVILREPYLNYPNRPHQANLISGFLHYLDKSNPSVAEIFRVDCRSIPALRRIYPVFLPRGALSAFEFENIINIASEQETNAQLISEIAWCKYYALDDRKRVRLLRMLLGRQDGPALVVNALNMLIYIEKDSQDAWPEALRIVGLDAITTIISNQKSDLNIDTNMVDTLLYCLHDENSIHAARIMDAIIDRDMLYYLGAYDFKFILVIIAMRKPHVFLSKIFPDGTDQTSIKLHNELSSNPLMHVSLEALIVWCRKDTTRWLKVARNISPFFPGLDEDGRAGRIYPLAIDFLKASPNTVEVVEAYLQHLYPMSWSGSQADIMAHRLKHLETLGSDFSPEVGQTIARLAPDACARIAQIRNAEAKDNQERSQRFE